jgi:hypothetical protein
MHEYNIYMIISILIILLEGHGHMGISRRRDQARETPNLGDEARSAPDMVFVKTAVASFV